MAKKSDKNKKTEDVEKIEQGLKEELEEEELEEESLEEEKPEEKKPVKKRKTKKLVKKRKSKKEKEDPVALAIRIAVESGKTEFGARKGIKNSLLGKAKLIVLASNAPKELHEDIMYYSKLSNIPVCIFTGTNLELGSICGKPYSVSVLSIYDEGNSNIMSIIKKK